MGPVTTAGAVAQAHAETLVGVAIGQLVRPGSPAIYGNFLSSMALRSGSPTFGTPEPALGSLVVGQLARRVGLPLRCSGAFTSSKIADGQAMGESAVSMMAALLCGANFILHSAGWLEGGLAMGYEKFMMDLDLCGAATPTSGDSISRRISLRRTGSQRSVRASTSSPHSTRCGITRPRSTTAGAQRLVVVRAVARWWRAEQRRPCITVVQRSAGQLRRTTHRRRRRLRVAGVHRQRKASMPDQWY